MATHIQGGDLADAGIAGETAAPPVRRKRKFSSGIEIVLLAVFAIVMLFPVVWMLETALKDGQDIYAVPAKIITGWTPTLDSFKKVFSDDSPVLDGFKNSIWVAGWSTIIATAFGVPAAWAYSRFKIPAKKDQLFFILSTRFMPPVVVVIPIFLMFRLEWINLLDTRLGLILVYSAFNLPFTIWMMKGFIDEVPARVRGGRDARRLLALRVLLARDDAAADPGHRRHGGVRADLLLERVRVLDLPDHDTGDAEPRRRRSPA